MIREYQNWVRDTGYVNKEASLLEQRCYAALGLCGEAGEVAERVKKIIRDKYNPVLINISDEEQLTEELGDVFWYLTFIANLFNIDMDFVIKYNRQKLEERYG